MRWTGVLGGAMFGGVFFSWIAGLRVLHPTEFEWLMKLDWRINFLGWHLFRNDPWRIPPGTIESYLAGEGTTIGFTDSIPLAALTLKPFDAWLPTPFQYFGLWLLLCFVLQGAFGALITRIYTRSAILQISGAALFVLVPTLLMRVGHAALTAHFVLLWAIWIYLSNADGRRVAMARQAVPAFVAGLIHPYLAAMTLALLAAIPLRDRTRQSALAFSAASAATVAAWWIAGFISVSSTTDLTGGGLGLYSMNLLSPITPHGWSTMLPEWPVASEMQAYEGFQYLGVGTLVLLCVAAVMLLRTPQQLSWRRAWPIAAVCVAAAIYALSPRVMVGDLVLVDWTSPTIDRLAFFRASGRFFWPMTYLLLSAALAVIVSRTGKTFSTAILLAAIALQFLDLRVAHEERRTTSRSEAFHTWPRQLSPVWHDVLPHYEHVVIVPAWQCGGAPIEHEELAYLAGLYQLTINSGLGARWNEHARRSYCESLNLAVAAGRLDDDALYVVSAAHEEQMRTAASRPIVCGPIDNARVCVTAASYEPWRHVVRLSE